MILNDNLQQIPSHLPCINITVSYDMGWQKRSGGRVYDSLSGHGFFIGCRSNKVVDLGVMRKKCSICTSINETINNIPPHKCNVNHTGSSGSMECALALDLTQKFHETTQNKAAIGQIVTDDDTTMRSNIKHKGDKAKLPINVPEPIFLADPTHRIKVMVRKIFGKAVKSKDPQKIKTIDALRLKKYTSLYIHQNRTGDFKEFVSNAMAPVEHLFNEHSFCNPEWCYSKAIEQKVDEVIVFKKTKMVSNVLNCETNNRSAPIYNDLTHI